MTTVKDILKTAAQNGIKLSFTQLDLLNLIINPVYSVPALKDFRGFSKNTVNSLLKKGLIRPYQNGDPKWKKFVATDAGRAVIPTDDDALAVQYQQYISSQKRGVK